MRRNLSWSLSFDGLDYAIDLMFEAAGNCVVINKGGLESLLYVQAAD